jgi:hypothetical protein
MKKILIALAMLAASGCASTPAAVTPPVESKSAFTEEPMSGGRYRIAFVSPEAMATQEVSDRVLRRAAQVTLDKGQEWFEISSKVDGKLDGKPTQTLVIQMGKGETLAGGPKQYNAKETLAAARNRIS